MMDDELCRRGGKNCGSLDCAWGCCYPRPNVVPTGVVPRVSVKIDPEKGRYAQVFVSESGDATVRYTDTLPRVQVSGDEKAEFANCTFSDPVQKAVDDYLLMERKARAWDELRDFYGVANPAVVDRMDALVHPAHVTAPATAR